MDLEGSLLCQKSIVPILIQMTGWAGHIVRMGK